MGSIVQSFLHGMAVVDKLMPPGEPLEPQISRHSGLLRPEVGEEGSTAGRHSTTVSAIQSGATPLSGRPVRCRLPAAKHPEKGVELLSRRPGMSTKKRLSCLLTPPPRTRLPSTPS